MIARTPAEIVAAIEALGPEETDAEAAARLGVSARTVRRYRTAARKRRAEVAREAVESSVQQAAPFAIESLVTACRIANEEMTKQRTPQWVRECRECAVRLLGVVGLGTADPVSGVSDEDVVAELRQRGVI